MTLLPPDIAAALQANARAAQLAELTSSPVDPVPLLKLFHPLSAATWLATELDDDGDTLFGLADLGFGCPELGSFSLSEIEQVRVPFGLRIERDSGFSTRFPLSIWTAWSRHAGSILWAETLLRRVALAVPELPNGGQVPGDG